MLQATGEARCAEIMELSWYNSILADVELDGSRWSYTNPLRWHGKEHELWSYDYHERHVPGLRHICCPTNVLRHIAAYQGYLFSISEKTLWLHHYADCDATFKKLGLELRQRTDYPWDGKITLTIRDAPDHPLTFKLRIPSWTDNAVIGINDVKDDVVFEQIAVDAGTEFEPEYRRDLLGGVTVLKSTAIAMAKQKRAIVGQYVDITEQKSKTMKVELIPYYAWNNRDEPKMSVWLPLYPTLKNHNLTTEEVT